MSKKPIFTATHPRACSTAFERVFMNCQERVQCIHEPFGDAFYYGPERLSERYENDPKGRRESGFEKSTYRTIFENIDSQNSKGKRVFIKDMTYYLMSPDQKPTSIAPSLVQYQQSSNAATNGDTNGSSHKTRTEKLQATTPPHPFPTFVEAGNPTLVPTELLAKFHWTFLIRHPRNSVPSYYRCTIPPLDEVTGFYTYLPSEAGYDELRRLFDYLRSVGLIAGHGSAENNGEINGTSRSEQVEICVIDADNLLDDPAGVIGRYCESVGLEYSPDMLSWDVEESHGVAKEKFKKWKGFHEDAIHSTELRPRERKKDTESDDELYAKWVDKFGEEGAKVIKETVDKNVADYEYLKKFAMKV